MNELDGQPLGECPPIPPWHLMECAADLMINLTCNLLASLLGLGDHDFT